MIFHLSLHFLSENEEIFYSRVKCYIEIYFIFVDFIDVKTLANHSQKPRVHLKFSSGSQELPHL